VIQKVTYLNGFNDPYSIMDFQVTPTKTIT